EAPEMTESVARADAQPSPPRRSHYIGTHKGMVYWTYPFKLPGWESMFGYSCGYTGLDLKDNPITNAASNRDSRKGSPRPTNQVVVAKVAPGSPAYRSGIRSGDIITSMKGEVLTDAGHGNWVIQKNPPGRMVIVFQRGRKVRGVVLRTVTDERWRMTA